VAHIGGARPRVRPRRDLRPPRPRHRSPRLAPGGTRAGLHQPRLPRSPDRLTRWLRVRL